MHCKKTFVFQRLHHTAKLEQTVSTLQLLVLDNWSEGERYMRVTGGGGSPGYTHPRSPPTPAVPIPILRAGVGYSSTDNFL